MHASFAVRVREHVATEVGELRRPALPARVPPLLRHPVAEHVDEIGHSASGSDHQPTERMPSRGAHLGDNQTRLWLITTVNFAPRAICLL
ncbi:hypothetical protein ACFPRL_18770 [Pseudoclavibacter helvolus]